LYDIEPTRKTEDACYLRPGFHASTSRRIGERQYGTIARRAKDGAGKSQWVMTLTVFRNELAAQAEAFRAPSG
jgi:hypothetical protein